jgi:hypothetical protein
MVTECVCEYVYTGTFVCERMNVEKLSSIKAHVCRNHYVHHSD